MLILIVVIVIIGIYLLTRNSIPKGENAIHKDASPDMQNVNITSDLESHDSFNNRINSCENCRGTGWEYYCSHCFSKPVYYVIGDYDDVELYCKKCKLEGKEYDDIIEDLCSLCGGTGKEQNY